MLPTHPTLTPSTLVAPAPASPPALDAPPAPLSPWKLFCFIYKLAFAVVEYVITHIPTPPDLDLLNEAVECFMLLLRIEATLRLAPERFTVAQVQRLAKAAKAIEQIAGYPIDFSPWLAFESPSPSPSPVIPHSASRTPHSNDPDSRESLGTQSNCKLATPGATLARVCQTLARLLKKLPRTENHLSSDAAASIPPAISTSNPQLPSPVLSPSPSPSSVNPQSSISNLQSGNPQLATLSVHPVHPVHPVHSSPSPSPSPYSIRAPD